MGGAPTWHTGADEQRSGTSWDDWLYDTLPSLELEGKKVAIFGCGDQESYADYYCDAAGELYDQFTAKGCKVYGLTSTDGYNHADSKAQRDWTESSLVLCATRTTNMTCLRTVPKLGLRNLKMKDSSKRIASNLLHFERYELYRL